MQNSIWSNLTKSLLHRNQEKLLAVGGGAGSLCHHHKEEQYCRMGLILERDVPGIFEVGSGRPFNECNRHNALAPGNSQRTGLRWQLTSAFIQPGSTSTETQ